MGKVHGRRNCLGERLFMIVKDLVPALGPRSFVIMD